MRPKNKNGFKSSFKPKARTSLQKPLEIAIEERSDLESEFTNPQVGKIE
jgi:hypothetical protein